MGSPLSERSRRVFIVIPFLVRAVGKLVRRYRSRHRPEVVEAVESIAP